MALPIELVDHQASFLVSIVALSRNDNRLLMLSWLWDHSGLRDGRASGWFRVISSRGLYAFWLRSAIRFTSSVEGCLLRHRSCCCRSLDQSCVWIIWITHRWLLHTNCIHIATTLLRPGSLVVEVSIWHSGFTWDLVLMVKLLSYYAVWLRLHSWLHICRSCLLSWRCPRMLLDCSLCLVCRLDCRWCLIWRLQKHLLLLLMWYYFAWRRNLSNSVVKCVSSCMSSLVDRLGFVFASTGWRDIARSIEDDILTRKHRIKLFNLLDLASVHILICRRDNCTGDDLLLDELLLLLVGFSNMLDFGAPTALKLLHDHVGIVTQFLSSFTIDTVFVSTDLALDKNIICLSASLSVPTCSVLVLSIACPTSWIHHNWNSVSALKRTALLFVTSNTSPVGWVSIRSWFVVVLWRVSVMWLCHLGVLVQESLIATLLHLFWVLQNCRYHLLLA